MEVDARELPPPKLIYNKNKIVMPREGIWDSLSLQLHTPKRIDNWFVVVFDDPRNFSELDAQNSIIALSNSLKKAGK